MALNTNSKPHFHLFSLHGDSLALVLMFEQPCSTLNTKNHHSFAYKGPKWNNIGSDGRLYARKQPMHKDSLSKGSYISTHFRLITFWTRSLAVGHVEHNLQVLSFCP